jgi:hypothetical protein
MGVVYEAAQDSPRRPVALKVIRPGLSETARQRPGQALTRTVNESFLALYSAPHRRSALRSDTPCQAYRNSLKRPKCQNQSFCGDRSSE